MADRKEYNARRANDMYRLVSEDEEQIAIFKWARLQESLYPELKQLHHIPNGGLRSKATAAKLKAMGVKPGVPDMCLPVPRNGCHGLYIELKRREGGVISPAQGKWLEDLYNNGYQASVCYGADEAIKVIKEYLRGEEEKTW